MRKKIYLALPMLVMGVLVVGQEKQTYSFEPVYDIPTTEVKSQDRTGTCWSYSTTSFIETEVLRLGGPVLDISEMFFVRHVYPQKAKRYVMAHGKGNFSEGGQAHDVMNALKLHGMVTEAAYPGKCNADAPHNHSELVSTQSVVLDNFIKQKGAAPSAVWYDVQAAILDVFMGPPPTSVSHQGKDVTPVEFASALKIVPDDYVELTSYLHHPWYKAIDLEVPDNWSHDLYYNLPLDELMAVMDHALANGYSFVWDGDVSEKHFSHREGLAIVPLSEESDFKVQEEQVVDQALRQSAFMSWQSTDDHLMHITGLSKSADGTRFYKTKNSWGTGRNAIGGYLYMSQSYMRLHTVAVMVHKEAIPKAIRKKIGL